MKHEGRDLVASLAPLKPLRGQALPMTPSPRAPHARDPLCRGRYMAPQPPLFRTRGSGTPTQPTSLLATATFASVLFTTAPPKSTTLPFQGSATAAARCSRAALPMSADTPVVNCRVISLKSSVATVPMDTYADKTDIQYSTMTAQCPNGWLLLVSGRSAFFPKSSIKHLRNHPIRLRLVSPLQTF